LPVELLKATGSDAQGVAQNDRMVGFLMPRVKGMHSILDFTIKTRQSAVLQLYISAALRAIWLLLLGLHARGYCIGDVNRVKYSRQ